MKDVILKRQELNEGQIEFLEKVRWVVKHEEGLYLEEKGKNCFTLTADKENWLWRLFFITNELSRMNIKFWMRDKEDKVICMVGVNK